MRKKRAQNRTERLTESSPAPKSSSPRQASAPAPKPKRKTSAKTKPAAKAKAAAKSAPKTTSKAPAQTTAPAKTSVKTPALVHADETPPAHTTSDRQQKAVAIIKHHAVMSGATCILPIPLLNWVAVAGVQLKLIRDLATMYDVPFKRDLVKALITGLAGGALPAAATQGGAMGGMLYSIPLAGKVAAALFSPAAAGAIVYATGHVFRLHFEAGGTLSTFTWRHAGEHFNHFFKQATT